MPSGPSGIALQLRGSADETPYDQQSDAMNLDDFIVPSSVASPAGVAAEAPVEDLNTQNNSHVGIAIKRKDKSQQQMPKQLPAASLPRQMQNKGRPGEFDYVQRRVRKTSIDEKSVCFPAVTHPSRYMLIPYTDSQATS